MRLNNEHVNYVLDTIYTNTSTTLGIDRVIEPFVLFSNFSSVSMVAVTFPKYDLYTIVIPKTDSVTVEKKYIVAIKKKLKASDGSGISYSNLEDWTKHMLDKIKQLIHESENHDISYFDFDNAYSPNGWSHESVLKCALAGKDLSRLISNGVTKIAIECAITVDPSYLQNLENPTESMANYICDISWKNIQYVNNLKSLPKTCRKIIEKDPWIVFSLPFVNIKLLKYAASVNGLIISMIEDQDEELCEIAITENPHALKHVKNKTRKLMEIALTIDYHTLIFIDDQECQSWADSFALSVNVNAIKIIKYPTVAQITKAMNEDGELLPYAKMRNLDIVLAALKSKGLAIRFVEKPSEFMAKVAVKSDPMALIFIKDQTYELCLMAAKIDKNAISAIKNEYTRKRVVEELYK